ncbi:OFA family MFS transporter [Phormidium sp. LEGE 05292]|uniref:L-lactate MFS transporter n=1 Tax=[Phormidium] sp. LEGE 05292 TaxID=767427 RepID=UPI00187FB8FA|nr:OFA family MFS transporter [Phormidium sp. LEGE 05292]MBE9227755.1 OFA family MFS transporter [Phormidium sp. LEGE 05292]
METTKVFGMAPEQGRWLYIPLGLIVLLCLGTVYSWSIFRKPLETAFSIGATESLLPFTVLLVVFAILMPVTGFFIDKYGCRTVTAVGGIITGLGYIFSSFATNISTLVFTYGIIAGAGVGIAYGVPLAVTARWFPDKKGLAVGLTVIGFGLSPLVTAPIAKLLIETYKVAQTFLILGIAFTIIILLISATLTFPPKDWKPAASQSSRSSIMPINYDGQMLQTSSFYGLWICYTIGTFVGLSAIGISSPVAQEIIKLDAGTAAATVSLFAVFNGLGRPLFGWLADKYKPRNAAIINYVLILIASILMSSAGEGNVASYLVAFCLFWLSLGGWLAIAPTATLTLFDPNNYAKNYGIVFTAYGVGALFGTIVAGRIRDIFGSYTLAFSVTAILAIVGIICAWFLLKRSEKVTSEMDLS